MNKKLMRILTRAMLVMILVVSMAIPAFATAPALITVGFMMLTSIMNIDFTDFSEAIPAFLAIIAMPFTYSISEGIALGVISYVLIHLTSGNYRFKNIGGIIYILAVLFVLKYIFV